MWVKFKWSLKVIGVEDPFVGAGFFFFFFGEVFVSFLKALNFGLLLFDFGLVVRVFLGKLIEAIFFFGEGFHQGVFDRLLEALVLIGLLSICKEYPEPQWSTQK